MFLGNIPDIFLSTEKPPAMLKGWSPISWVIPPSGGNSRIFLSDVELLLCKEKKNGWAPKREAFQVVNGHCSTTCRTRKKNTWLIRKWHASLLTWKTPMITFSPPPSKRGGAKPSQPGLWGSNIWSAADAYNSHPWRLEIARPTHYPSSAMSGYACADSSDLAKIVMEMWLNAMWPSDFVNIWDELEPLTGLCNGWVLVKVWSLMRHIMKIHKVAVSFHFVDRELLRPCQQNNDVVNRNL